jgi:serine/threonine-protein kinase
MSTPDSDGASNALIGQTLAGQFLIEKKLGEGGMGAVYLATQLGMERRVVVKVMHAELTVGNPNAVQRFQREARAVAALNHPNIVQVHVFGQSGEGQLFQAMEFIDGRDLATELTNGPLKQDRALRILAQITAALEDAHAAGIVHRDLKPENVMLTHRHGNPDWVKVLDFGIAKLHETQEGGGKVQALTQAGAVFGTPAYMSPEQVRGVGVDARTDLYALGVILHEMVAGVHPFEATSPIDFLVKHVNEPVVPLSRRFPALNVAPAIETLVMKLLAKDAAERYQSATELQQAIQAALLAGGFLPGTPGTGVGVVSAAGFTQTPPSGLPQRPDPAGIETVTHVPEPPRRGKGVWLFAALALLVVGGGVAAAVVLGGTTNPEAPMEVAAVVGTAVVPEVPAAAPVQDVAPAVMAEADVVAEDAVAATAEDVVETEVAIEAVGDVVIEAAALSLEFEGFPAPAGTTLMRTQTSGLKLAVPLAPGDILAFYRERFDGAVREVRNGLEFTDVANPWKSIVLGVEGGTMVVQATRRTAGGPVKVEMPTPGTPEKPVVLTPPEELFKPTEPTKPAEPVVVQPTEPAQPTPPPTTPPPTFQPTQPLKPPVIRVEPGQLPTEIEMPDGTRVPIHTPRPRQVLRELRRQQQQPTEDETGTPTPGVLPAPGELQPSIRPARPRDGRVQRLRIPTP